MAQEIKFLPKPRADLLLFQFLDSTKIRTEFLEVGLHFWLLIRQKLNPFEGVLNSH